MSEANTEIIIHAQREDVTLFENSDGIFVYPPNASKDVARSLVMMAFDESDSGGYEVEISPEDIIPSSIILAPRVTKTLTPNGAGEARRISWMTEEDRDLEIIDRLHGTEV